jgi:hypothetical protein
MSSTIKIKRSSVAGKAPNTSILSTGEIALNFADKRLYTSNGTSILEIGTNPSSLSINGQYQLPSFDGANNQILSTDGNGLVRFVSLETATPGAGYDNSTVAEFPTGDYGIDEDFIGDPDVISLDAFGVSIGGNVFDNMDPVGRLESSNLGAL